MGKNKVFYLECTCGIIDDIVRFHYDPEEKEIYLDFRIEKFPGKDFTYTIDTKKNFHTLKYNLFRLKFYFKNVWYAFKGVPNWYRVQSVWYSDNDLEKFKNLNIWINDVIKDMESNKPKQPKGRLIKESGILNKN